MKKSKLLFFRVICFKLILFTLRFPFLCPKQKIFVKDDICSRQSFKKSYKSNSQLKKSKLLFLRVICFLLFPFLCPKLQIALHRSSCSLYSKRANCSIALKKASTSQEKPMSEFPTLALGQQAMSKRNNYEPITKQLPSNHEIITCQSRNNYLPSPK